jgi:hypothetical protein
MNKTYGAIFALPVLSLYAVSGWSQEMERPNYNFVGLEYVYATADVNSSVLPAGASDNNWYYDEGVQLNASFALNDKWLFRGDYYTASGDYRGRRDIDFSTALVGVGIILPTDDAVGIDLSLEYRLDDIEFDNSDTDIDGIGISFGVRSNVTEKQEVGMRFGFYGGDFDESIALKLSYAYNFTDTWALTTSYDYSDVGLDSSESEGYTLSKWLIGGRFSF